MRAQLRSGSGWIALLGSGFPVFGFFQNTQTPSNMPSLSGACLSVSCCKGDFDTTFVRMSSGDHLGDAKMSKKGTSLRRILIFLLIAIDRNGFRRMIEEGQIYQ